MDRRHPTCKDVQPDIACLPSANQIKLDPKAMGSNGTAKILFALSVNIDSGEK